MQRFRQGRHFAYVFGLIAVATMIPLSFADKRAAMLSAFFSRFAIGSTVAQAVRQVLGEC